MATHVKRVDLLSLITAMDGVEWATEIDERVVVTVNASRVQNVLTELLGLTVRERVDVPIDIRTSLVLTSKETTGDSDPATDSE